jgi:hypothetical protein
LAKVSAYAGSGPPAAEEDFNVERPANQAEGWRTYEYVFDVRGSPDGQVWVALGVSAVWETQMTYFVDEIQVTIGPAEAGAPGVGAPILLLPESAVPVHRVSADLNGDGAPELAVLTGWGGGNRLGYDFMQMFVIVPAGPGEYVIAWQSEQLPTDRAEPLQVQDLNGDGVPEVRSVQAMGAGGERLYLLGWQEGGYGWLSPQGGYFDGREAFGETGVRVEDVDGDGVAEILASYGPATSQIDLYAWNGEAYAYQETLDAAEARYQRVNVAQAGLSLEVPVEWGQVEPGVWAAPGDDGSRLGVQWANLQPPQEPEAALLPQPAQVIESGPVQLAWGSGRWFVVEVYGEAVQGQGRAPVEAVEIHTLIVVERNGARRAYDVYASAPTREQLLILEPVLDHALESVVLE